MEFTILIDELFASDACCLREMNVIRAFAFCKLSWVYVKWLSWLDVVCLA